MSFFSNLVNPKNNIDRLLSVLETRTDQTIQTFDPILEEIYKMGEKAIRPICDFLRRENTKYASKCLAAIALVRIGQQSEGHLIDIISSTKNDHVRIVCSSAFLCLKNNVQSDSSLALLSALKRCESIVLSQEKNKTN